MTMAIDGKLSKRILWPQWIAGFGGKLILSMNTNEFIQRDTRKIDQRRTLFVSFVIRNRSGIDGRLVIPVHQRINISEFFVHNYDIRAILGCVAVQSRQIDRLYQRCSVQRLFWQ